MPEPARPEPAQPEPARPVYHDVDAMTAYMVNRLGAVQRGAFEERRNGWRHMIAGNYQ